ncbi:hypothetical protein [Streptomyces sp. NPDC001604]|uniref:hypothetical protein n=1 Tax=Streptomyces sp. NPDC001604 TaxID=3364593 RepID=UPI0036A97569
MVPGDRIIDLCAGIGRLAWHARDSWNRRWVRLPPGGISVPRLDATRAALCRRVGRQGLTIPPGADHGARPPTGLSGNSSGTNSQQEDTP